MGLRLLACLSGYLRMFILVPGGPGWPIVFLLYECFYHSLLGPVLIIVMILFQGGTFYQ
ncbi:hypothetical protein HOY82DRAFT_298858 [Tuber indicum]|nr:hypothetical protein HOY82DRAFT_298858 [Tuber indicum]